MLLYRIADAIMMSPGIIIGTVFPTIIERLKLIKLFRDRHRSRTISRHSLVLYRDRRSAIKRSPRREVSRGHSTIVLQRLENELTVLVDNACVLRSRSLGYVEPRAVRSKKLPRHAIKTRIDTTCPAATFAHRERRHADCKSSSLARSIATQDRDKIRP